MTTRVHDAVVVGAGFSGIAATISLKNLGFHDVVVLDREDDLGGTWHVNRYPGVAVDIFSTSYQYWFEPNPHWSRLYAPGEELKAYADHVCDKYDVRRHVRCGATVEDATWDEDAKRWTVTLVGGEQLHTRFLISATGFLSQRHRPDIPGLDDFDGEVLHTTWWDRSRSLVGRRVAVVGTGATSVQLVPELAKVASDLTVYQRTPIWVTPKLDFALPRVVRRVFARLPRLHRAISEATDRFYESVLTSVILDHRRFHLLGKAAELQCRAVLRLRVRDRRVRRALTPDYSFGCKRPSVSNSYYATFDRPHVHLQTSGIARIESDAIVANDGTRTTVDTLVLATGFDVWQHNFPGFTTAGRGGTDLGDWWRARRYESYQGLTVPEFPNYLAMTAPWAFTGLSYFTTIQAQVLHIERLLGEVRRRGARTFEVRDEANREFVERMRSLLPDTVLYHGSCASSRSYYFNSAGDAAWFRPTSSRSGLDEQRTFPLSDYVFDDDLDGEQTGAARHTGGVPAPQAQEVG